MATTNYSWNLPTVGGSEDTWGTQLNANWTALDTLLGGTNATEFAILDGATVTTAELNVLDGITASTAELNLLDGVTLNLTAYNSLTASAAELNILDGALITTTELNYLDGATSNIQTQINNLVASAGNVPSGGIIMWSGSTSNIPSGWFLCNGANGTPDLRDRFIVGAGGSYAVGATGGADSVTLTTSQIPAHTHTGTTSTDGAHSHTYTAFQFGIAQRTNSSNDADHGEGTFSTSTAGAHSHTFTTASTGGGASHENRPPYYALAYIMKA